MKLYRMYLVLVLSCWGMLLHPQLYFYTESKQEMLGVRILNIWPALIQASFYTMPAVLALCLPSHQVLRGRVLVRYNCNWLFMIPYIMHCLYGFGNGALHMFLQMRSLSVLNAANFIRALVKIILVYSMQMYAILEMAMTLCYGLKILALDGSRLY
ncbi:uncharacterized protein LOC115771198 [Drosophila novamexicana]|uniref:uncharacterized protein LOC115771198 n=1 Tax=Drosophila novamexicana TaxID=47314 RepID=UPI0011E5CCC0|nr:uncharacterized protein LOC115771198 [Drosophila novamexicana]